MEKFLNNKYTLVRNDENYDAYLEAIGFSAENREVAKATVASYQLVKLSGNEYSSNTFIGPRISENKFVPGVETERTTLDGRKVKTTFTIEGNKLIDRQVGSIDVSTVRIFSDNELVVELNAGGITTKAYFKLVQ